MALTPSVEVPFQDPTLSPRQRAADLLARLPLEDKAGLLFHGLTVYGAPTDLSASLRMPTLTSTIARHRITHIAVVGDVGNARQFAEWHNAAQDLAATVGLGIPITFSTDPRHGFVSSRIASTAAQMFSQWPESLGLAALRSEEAVTRFAEAVREEYLAVGLRLALHPQIDVATEPRWARVSGTFGEDPALVARLGAAYIRGLQGPTLGPSSVAAMAKHFPGGGPQKDGEDPHFAYGKEQVYPGGHWDDHLLPFSAAIDAGVAAIMPYYGLPLGTEFEEVGFAYNKAIVTELLRERMGFDGIVCTDFGVISDTTILDEPLPARAWGVEHLTTEERLVRLLDAGCDQFGGEFHTADLVAAVRAGLVSEERIDASAAKLLEQKFVLGLFENRTVDVNRAAAVARLPRLIEAGLDAQRASMTLLTNGAEGAPVLPLIGALVVFLDGASEAAFGDLEVTGDLALADVAVVRVSAPFEPRERGFEPFLHAGGLDFPDDVRDRILAVCAAVPTVLVVSLERPAVLTPFVPAAAAIIAEYGASDAAVADVLLGRAEPLGVLPLDLPRSMESVVESASDTPFDLADPLFRFGHGLRYAR